MTFVEQGEYEAAALRQGDVVRDVHFVGSICYREVMQPAALVDGQPASQWTVQNKLASGPAVVLSQCCEISKENGVKLTSIILAPLRDVSTATHPDKVQELIDSNELDEASGRDFSFLKYFYVPQHPSLPFPRGGVVDYSKIFSVRKSSFDFLLGKKVLQMTDEKRGALALKLAVYFYRESSAA